MISFKTFAVFFALSVLIHKNYKIFTLFYLNTKKKQVLFCFLSL
jgi:hypothetical protein